MSSDPDIEAGYLLSKIEDIFTQNSHTHAHAFTHTHTYTTIPDEVLDNIRGYFIDSQTMDMHTNGLPSTAVTFSLSDTHAHMVPSADMLACMIEHEAMLLQTQSHKDADADVCADACVTNDINDSTDSLLNDTSNTGENILPYINADVCMSTHIDTHTHTNTITVDDAIEERALLSIELASDIKQQQSPSKRVKFSDVSTCVCDVGVCM